MDANLAEVDIESFKTEDIHALLTTLPPMCTDHFSQEVRTSMYFYTFNVAYLLPRSPTDKVKAMRAFLVP